MASYRFKYSPLGPTLADTALRLGKYFGTSAETWLDLQSDYDLRMIRRTAGDEIEAQVRVRAA
jgi:plasmid maintenance system antidote protein VapI